MKHWRPALLWTAVLAAGLGLWAGQHWGPQPATSAPSPAPRSDAAALGQPMPGLRLPDLEGDLVDLRQWHGRPLLINVWASWCTPCVEEMPELQRFASAQGPNGIQVLGLALDNAEDVRGFLQQVPVNYPIVLDVPGPADASVRLGNRQGLLPYTVLIDAQGIVRAQKLGPFAHGEIEGWAAAALP